MFTLPCGEEYKGIGDYGAIGNMRTLALVGYDGSIDWCCFPRFDSPSIFAAILDSRKGGRWVITPSNPAGALQSYIKNTNVLQTRFIQEGSSVKVIDFIPCGDSSDPENIDGGALSSVPEIHRIARCERGAMKLKMHLEPRFFYGRLSGKVIDWREGFSFSCLTEELVFSTSVSECKIKDNSVECDFLINEGESHHFVLSYGESRPRKIQEYDSEGQLKRTKRFWNSYASALKYDGRWKDRVIRSALLLRLLVYSPTGAIVAAPTTSLPESLGGERNWDYRYSWIRDSAFSLWAFHVLGSRSEAERYLHWLILNNPALDRDLRLMYRVTGETRLDEQVLSYLDGYKGSRPVRVGNDAFRQVQLDAHGVILDALYFSSKHGYGVSNEIYYRFVRPLAYFICENWRKKGNGVWEFRNLHENFVYTKAWCYIGLDRACKIAKVTDHDGDIQVWQDEMERIKEEIMRKGWNEKTQAFTMYYGSDYLDASLLLLPMIGFIDARDARMEKTVDAIMKKLSKNGLLKRYDAPDGLRGEEGSFLICNFWLVSCLARMGRIKEAERLFKRLLSLSNHLGLYSEEVDFQTGAALGNFPQAFSHMGFIMAAVELDRALRS
ncbi:MAG: glycoside hydrolase family 15 protein [Conexivisphaerales archaeon]